jgi:glycosyltransferase involved in cell wall biosynthesis
MHSQNWSILYVLPHLEYGNFDGLRQERINREFFITKKTRDLQLSCNLCGMTFGKTKHQLADMVSSLRFPVDNAHNKSKFDFISQDLLTYIESSKPDLVVFKGLGYRLSRWLLLHSRHKFRFALIAAGGTRDPLAPFADYVLAETPAQIKQSFLAHQASGRVSILPKLNFPGMSPLSMQKDFDVINVGTFNQNKNQQALLPLATDYRLALVGDGDYWEAVRGKAAPYGESVFMPGNLPRAQIGPIIARSRLMVHTAHHEGLARVVMEAFAVGVPVVASRRAMPEAFEHGVQGLLVEPDKLLGAARELLADQRRLEAMGQAALEFANSHCTEEAVFAEVRKMYDVVFSTPPVFTGSWSQILRIRWRTAVMKLLPILKSWAKALGVKRVLMLCGMKN